eukprot:TRINITY_DN366_c0_g1_i1.p2 TRINITY_DN366_c0_g1~~TRINITY_DN366_c0_g1_i1.p2  ORF type:complete len:1259 (+),score=293.33 TRINITY_DN366_c0_g1_i1:32345-36121(+)
MLVFLSNRLIAVKPKTNEGTAKPRSKEMEEFLSSIGETKTLHANLHAKTSTRAKEMFDKMKETRRAKHIEALNEYESWIETFGESMKERYEDRKSQSNSLRDTTGAEVERTLADMTDQTLLASDLEYVTYAWDHVAEIRKERKQEIGLLGNSLRELHRVKKNSIIEYITNLKAKLIDIAFLLEPQIVGIIQEILDKQQKELEEEGKEIDTYLADVSEREQKLFEEYYKRWKEKKERFHLLKQNEAIENFKKRLNEKYFVNPEERVTKMKQLMDYQLKVYNSRKSILAELQAIPISEITKEKVNDLDEKLKKINEDASDEYKKFFQACIKIQEERHKEALALVEYLKGFLVKNDAELPEGKTFDMIIAEECSPLVELRLKESKELLLHIDKYLEEFESRMHEYSKNIISFYRFIGENYDQNRKDTQNLELQFELSIAKLADQNEENMNKRDAELKSYVDSLKKSVTQITLVERVEKCYNMLDTMNKEYDAYEKELKELVSTQEPKVVKHYQSFELKLAQHFKMDTLDKKDAIQERLAKETEEKQKKMEEEYMKKKEQEELLAAQQNPPAGAKGASPVKGKPAATDKSKGKGKGQAEPNPDLPKLEVPKVQEYVSPSGETYAVDYPLEYLAESLMRTEEEIEYERLEEEKRIEEKKREEAEAAAADPKAKGKPAAAKKGKVETKKEELAKKLEEEEKIRKEQEEKEMQRKAEAEEKERLRANVPKDPEKNQCLHDGLLISKQEIVSILSEALQKVMGQIGEMRQRYIETLREKNEETITKNMKDVDTLFQKPWPEEESIEVDVFQTRQSEIVNHKKIYDKHVRSVLKKNDADDRLFDSIVKEFKTMLNNYEQLLGKYMNALGNFSNLAELQGYLRKTKEAYNILTEQINKYRDDFKRLYTVEIDTLLKLNRNFVNSCTLQVNGGTYSEDEKEYYDTLIKYIDAKFVQCKENRQKTTLDLMQDAEKRRDEPYNAFEAKYAEANTNLAAKEGLGKVFGKPKRMLQDQLKAEMSKCDEAQNGINELMGKLKGMLEEYNKNAGSYFANRKPVTLSLDIRKTLIALRNCIVKYAEYLGAFKEGFTPDPLPRITSNESKEGIELSEEEQKVDAEAKLEEIRALGTIGYQAGTAKDVVFVTALEGIENNIKEAARKLYQGDNAQYLQGPDKIPEYLENYLKATHGQADEFKIGCIRALRTSVFLSYKNQMHRVMDWHSWQKSYQRQFMEVLKNQRQKGLFRKLLRQRPNTIRSIRQMNRRRSKTYWI